MTKSELRKELERLTTEFKGSVTNVAPKKLRRPGFTARANSPKRRGEIRGDIIFTSSSQHVGMRGTFAN